MNRKEPNCWILWIFLISCKIGWELLFLFRLICIHSCTCYCKFHWVWTRRQFQHSQICISGDCSQGRKSGMLSIKLTYWQVTFGTADFQPSRRKRLTAPQPATLSAMESMVRIWLFLLLKLSHPILLSKLSNGGLLFFGRWQFFYQNTYSKDKNLTSHKDHFNNNCDSHGQPA